MHCFFVLNFDAITTTTRISQMTNYRDIINNLSSSLVVQRVYIIGRLKPFFVVPSLFISNVEDYKIVQPEGI